MAPRKRKAPEKKARSFVAVLLSSTAIALGHLGRGLGTLTLRYPRQVVGGLFFAGIFGSVAANALWYQPHRLREPFLATRDLNHFDMLPGLRRHSPPASEVTTFKIERAEDAEPGADTAGQGTAAALGQPTAEDGDPDLRTAALPDEASFPATAADGQPENVALAVAVQQALIRRGLYEGAADGVVGPRTSAAILLFEQSEGMAPTGAVSEALLQALAADGAKAPAGPAKVTETDPVAAAIRNATIPAPAARPARQPAARPQAMASPPGASLPVVKASARADDLAALIRASDAGPADGQAAGEEQAAAEDQAAGDGLDRSMVLQIQKGLMRLQYPGISPNGLAGGQTRAAIRRFERAYDMPVTGEPSARVLQKLRDIGMV